MAAHSNVVRHAGETTPLENANDVSVTGAELQMPLHIQEGGENNYFFVNNSSININSGITNKSQSAYPSAFENILKSTKLAINHLDGENFAETRAFREARDRLEAFGVLVLTGRQGDGKTTIALHCLKALSKTRRPVIMRDPYDWDSFPRPQKRNKRSEKYIVMIDNIFGFYQICPTIKHRWMSKLDDMWLQVLCGHVSIVLVLRTQIFQCCQEQLSRFKMFQSAHHLSLSSPKYQLNRKEMLEISRCHLKNIKLDDYPDMTSVNLPNVAFPQICSFYASSKSVQKRGLQYFEHPLEYISKELKILKEQNIQQYFLLVMTMFLRGKLNREIFYPVTSCAMEEKHDFVTLGKTLRRLIPFSMDMTTNFESIADSMVGVFLSFSKKENAYRFLHPVIEDALLLSFTDISLIDVINICPVRVLNLYLRTPNYNHSEEDLAVVVKRNEVFHLAQRIAQELIEGDCKSILSHQALKDDVFVKILTQKVLKEDGCRKISKRNLELIHVQKEDRFLTAVDNLLYDAPNVIPICGYITKWLFNYSTRHKSCREYCSIPAITLQSVCGTLA